MFLTSNSYGALLGTTVYQSFVAGIVSYRALPRPQFATLQAKLTPVYFALQTILPCFLALTYPASPRGQGSLLGVLEPQNQIGVLVPILGMFVMGAANVVALGPATTKVMKQRKHQETRDGKKYYDQGEHSKEMTELNRRFARLHGLSALVNMVGMGFLVWYGAVLGERIA